MRLIELTATGELLWDEAAHSKSLRFVEAINSRANSENEDATNCGDLDTGNCGWVIFCACRIFKAGGTVGRYLGDSAGPLGLPGRNKVRDRRSGNALRCRIAHTFVQTMGRSHSGGSGAGSLCNSSLARRIPSADTAARVGRFVVRTLCLAVASS